MTTLSAPTLRPADWARLLLLSLFWGGSFFFIRVAVVEVPPFTLVLARVAIAAMLLWCVLPLFGVKVPRDPRIWFALAVLGFFNNVLPFSLISWGQQHVGTALAAILNGAAPLSTVLLAHIWTRDEKMTRARLGGVLLGFAGVVVLVGPEALSGIGLATLGAAAILLATFFYSVGVIVARRLPAVPPIMLATGQMTFGTLFMLPLALVFDQPWTLSPGPWSIGAIVALAIGSTAFGYLLYFRIIRDAGATNASLVTLLNPASAALLAIVFLGEWPGPLALPGFMLIAAGLLVVDGRLLRRRTVP
jgi:drug/metabolite transporter (DMT)-like permease